ncbi:hypothetical protein AB0B45_48380 [Nonomuraea sp. NPDC049152]
MPSTVLFHADTTFETAATSAQAPAVYDGKLHLVHRGGGIL